MIHSRTTLIAAISILTASAALGQDTFAPSRQPAQAPAPAAAPAQPTTSTTPVLPVQQPTQITQPDASQSRASQRGGRGNEAAEPLYGYSLLVVAPPQPRSYKAHDLVTI